jgi:hypothetical protein
MREDLHVARAFRRSIGLTWMWPFWACLSFHTRYAESEDRVWRTTSRYIAWSSVTESLVSHILAGAVVAESACDAAAASRARASTITTSAST